jgi:hypothetical protein
VWKIIDEVLASIRAGQTGQAAADQLLQGTKRAADAALDESNASKKSRHINELLLNQCTAVQRGLHLRL